MRTFQNEKLIKQETARLMPPDKTYKDCVVELLLTEQRLHVVEVGFGDEFTVPFSIPVGSIVLAGSYIDIRQGKMTKGVLGGKNQSETVAAALAMMMGGIL